MGDGLNLEAAAALLESSADYRVLRRLVPREPTGTLPPDENVKTGVFLDVETTGLDPDRDEIIELGMVRFSFSLEGEVLATDPPFSRLRQPSKPIPAEITRLTGITDEMVAGKAIDAAEVESFVEPAVIVIAHNAGFDRRFVEPAFPIFAKKAWGCSISDVPWREEGFEGSRLAYLAMRHGFFFDGHRATDDCHAALEILARDLPVSGEPALKRLLDNARKPTLRLWAIGSPFETKDILKARGYRWNAGENGNPKSWYIDLSEDATDDELAFLKEKVFNRDPDPRIDRITAFDRYSDRG